MSNSIKNSYIPKDKTTGYCDSSYLAEFEQGNFVHAAMQTRYTGQELLKIFLHNEHVSDEEKIKQLRYIIQRIRYIASDINQEYDNYIIQNNNEVRGNLKTAYQEYLKKGERISWMDFNNTSRWKSEGGKSHSDHSVEYPDHEWHDRYLQKRKEHIKECTTYILTSKLRDTLEIITESAKYFTKEEYEEVVQNMDIEEYKKTKILKTIQKAYLSI